MRFLAANAPLEQAKAVILGAPLEATETWRGGPAQAPEAIRYASDSVESFSAVFMVELEGARVHDAGDVDCSGQVREALARVERAVRSHLSAGRKTLLLGGEHTVTLGAFRAATAVFGKVQLLVLDAHTDLRDEYEGVRVGHATVTRRCLEIAERVVVVGARSFYGGEFDLLGKHPLHFASIEECASLLDRDIPIYLSLDMDSLDPSECPGVTNPEPGGLRYPQIIELFKTLGESFRVIGMDIVELAPPYDPSGVSAVCAAKLAVEALAGGLRSE